MMVVDHGTKRGQVLHILEEADRIAGLHGCGSTEYQQHLTRCAPLVNAYLDSPEATDWATLPLADLTERTVQALRRYSQR